MTEPTSTASCGLRLPPQRRVLLCVGPGGVGKTTVAAALGLSAAERRRRTLVVTIDPSRRLAQALGLGSDADRGHIVRVPGTDDHPLDCLLLDTQQVFDSIVRGYSPDEQSARRMLANPIYRATAQHLGGALEYAATAQVHMLVAERRYDLIILDTPPTANAIEFLDAPGRIGEVLDNAAARFLATSGRIGAKFLGLGSGVMLKAFEALGGGPFVGQLGSFLHDFGAVLGEFQRRAGDVADLLTSSETGVVLTTSANAFSVREARDFIRVLHERGLRIDGVVLNRVDPQLPPMPVESTIRRALQAQRSGDALEAAVASVVQVYADARDQSERTHEVRRDLEGAYPDFPICILERVDPPPTGLSELRRMGAILEHRTR